MGGADTGSSCVDEEKQAPRRADLKRLRESGHHPHFLPDVIRLTLGTRHSHHNESGAAPSGGLARSATLAWAGGAIPGAAGAGAARRPQAD